MFLRGKWKASGALVLFHLPGSPALSPLVGFQPPIDPSGLSPKSPPLGRLPQGKKKELDTPALGNLLFYYCINHKAVIETFAFHSVTQGLF